jgi:hypothetical protein
MQGPTGGRQFPETDLIDVLERDESFVASGEAVSCELGDGLALLDLASNVYYSLNGVGAFVWQQLQQPRSVAQLREAILEAYDVDPARCEADLSALLDDLSKSGLIRRVGGSDAGAP